MASPLFAVTGLATFVADSSPAGIRFVPVSLKSPTDENVIVPGEIVVVFEQDSFEYEEPIAVLRIERLSSKV
jgi:hypothetical protein